jgi:hypothetical protein
MSDRISRRRNAGLCLASAVLGGAVSWTAVAAASGHPATSRQPASTRHSAPAHYLHGGYILTDGGHCPKHTVMVNASVRARTNAPSGRSSFPLCHIQN